MGLWLLTGEGIYFAILRNRLVSDVEVVLLEEQCQSCLSQVELLVLLMWIRFWWSERVEESS